MRYHRRRVSFFQINTDKKIPVHFCTGIFQMRKILKSFSETVLVKTDPQIKTMMVVQKSAKNSFGAIKATVKYKNAVLLKISGHFGLSMIIK